MVNDYYNILPSKETLNSLIEFAKMQLIMMQKSHRYVGGQKSHRYVGGQIIVCPPVGDEPTPIKFCNNVKFHNDKNSCYIDALLSVIVNYNCAENIWFDELCKHKLLQNSLEVIKRLFVNDNADFSTSKIRDPMRRNIIEIAKSKEKYDKKFVELMETEKQNNVVQLYEALISNENLDGQLIVHNEEVPTTSKHAVIFFPNEPQNDVIINDRLPGHTIVGCVCYQTGHYTALFKKNNNPSDNIYYYDNDMSQNFEPNNFNKKPINNEIFALLKNKRLIPEIIFYEKL
jgi:hypothetical protein